MTIIATLALLLTLLLLLIIRWFASVPLVRTLSIAIDSWADDIQGRTAGRSARRPMPPARRSG